MVPGAQAVALTAPSRHAEPAGQIEQSLCAAPPGKARKLPAAHIVDALAPATQYEPGEHESHAVAPLVD